MNLGKWAKWLKTWLPAEIPKKKKEEAGFGLFDLGSSLGAGPSSGVKRKRGE